MRLQDVQIKFSTATKRFKLDLRSVEPRVYGSQEPTFKTKKN